MTDYFFFLMQIRIKVGHNDRFISFHTLFIDTAQPLIIYKCNKTK